MIRLMYTTSVLFLLSINGCEIGAKKLPKNGEDMPSLYSPGNSVRAFVYKEGSGALVSQGYEVWIEFSNKKGYGQRLLVADKTDGIKLKWIDSQHLSICCGPSQIYEYQNFFFATSNPDKINILLEQKNDFKDCS